MTQAAQEDEATWTGASPDPRVLDAVVTRVGRDLTSSFQSLLGALPGAPHRPQELARMLRINKDLSSRILKAMESRDPMATTCVIPGPEPLRRLIHAAERHVDPGTVEAAEASVRRFELLIRNVGGDRAGLDTIVSAWLPEVREKAELLSKQAVFKGMSQIRGASAEVDFVTRFVHPAADGNGLDYVLLSGCIGLRRLRPGVRVAINSHSDHTPARSREAWTLSGQRVESDRDMVLERFCSKPLPRIEIRREGDLTCMMLGGDRVGVGSASDVTWAHAHRSSTIKYVFSVVNMPARLGVCDLFLHRDVAARGFASGPALEIYDTTERGIARWRDPSRVLDLLDLRATVDPLGHGAARFRCADIPGYADMIAHVCNEMGWDPDAFDGFRCAIEYPVYGSQVVMAFAE